MPECSGRARPFLQSWLRRIAQDTPCGSSERRCNRRLSPWRHVPPQKNVGTAMRPGDSYKFGAAGIPAPIHRWLALQAVRVTAHRGTAARHPIQVPGAVAQSSHGACRSPSKVLREAACHIKRFVLLQNMEAGSRQFVRECLACDDRVSPGFLALIKTLGLGAIALGEVGRFHEGP